MIGEQPFGHCTDVALLRGWPISSGVAIRGVPRTAYYLYSPIAIALYLLYHILEYLCAV